MYQYKATVVGPLSCLRSEKKVKETSVGLADAYTEALNHYGSQGWRLHSVVQLTSPIVLLVFERFIPENSATTCDQFDQFTFTVTDPDIPVTKARREDA